MHSLLTVLLYRKSIEVDENGEEEVKYESTSDEEVLILVTHALFCSNDAELTKLIYSELCLENIILQEEDAGSGDEKVVDLEDLGGVVQKIQKAKVASSRSFTAHPESKSRCVLRTGVLLRQH